MPDTTQILAGEPAGPGPAPAIATDDRASGAHPRPDVWRPDTILALQRHAGNQAVGRALARWPMPPVQAAAPAPATAPAPSPAPAPVAKHYLPPEATLQEGLLGTGTLEDPGSTGGLVAAILSMEELPPSTNFAAQIRATFSADNIRQNARNIIGGGGLIAPPVSDDLGGRIFTQAVILTGRLVNPRFLRADGATLATASTTTTTSSSAGAIGTSFAQQLGGKAGVGAGERPANEISGSMTATETDTTTSTAGMGGATTRTISQPPGSCLFDAALDLEIHLEWTSKAATVSLLGPVVGPGARSPQGRRTTAHRIWGARVRFPGLECPEV